MAKADYTHKLHCNEDVVVHTISIIDLNLGGMSVTNNIEEVVEEICLEAYIDPASVNVVYRDSERVWDGWDTHKGVFIPMAELNEEDAVATINRLKPIKP